jgi:anionic cell wall polymer biosynthesis LytR-Cps2A-Psr (LCP) family protein
MPVIRDDEAERLAQIEHVLERIQRQQEELARLIRKAAALRKEPNGRRAAKTPTKRKQR